MQGIPSSIKAFHIKESHNVNNDIEIFGEFPKFMVQVDFENKWIFLLKMIKIMEFEEDSVQKIKTSKNTRRGKAQ